MSCACQHPSPLRPSAQGWYHLGCAARHVLRALAAFSRCRLSPFLIALCTLGLCLLYTGCSTAPAGAGTGFFSWWTHRGERATTAAENRHDDAREAQLLAARLEAEKTAQAAAALPPSTEATLTQRFAGNTTDLLTQAVPGATSEQLANVRQLVADLRSADAQILAAAEVRQRATEGHNATLSRSLATTAARLTAAQTRAHDIADTNADLAASLLWMRAAAAAGTLLSVIATVAALAYRANIGGLAARIASGLVTLERSAGADTATLARTALDQGLDLADKTKIGAAFAALAPDLFAARPLHTA
ncbi:hypothetical protein IMCC26134_15005 [Verrucomicrobia bacterium IMCC26134]|nr:hypothetical protein IMCC26134_15005 [Verrucomicrobia bacterium IMCC26134]